MTPAITKKTSTMNTSSAAGRGIEYIVIHYTANHLQIRRGSKHHRLVHESKCTGIG